MGPDLGRIIIIIIYFRSDVPIYMMIDIETAKPELVRHTHSENRLGPIKKIALITYIRSDLAFFILI